MHVTLRKIQLFNNQHLQQLLKGIQKAQATTHPPKVRLPIKLDIMQDIKHLLLQKPQTYASTMI